ncbi:MAG: AraC family transcriptional regulator [Clostridia bacterium]|nr:AraC family transcriptional regulator [Clostridia bacterium]
MCFLSTAQFYNLFNEQFEMTPLEYRNRLLTERAKELLSTTESTVAEIADMLGFSNIAYFSRFFKKQTGTSPSTYARGKSYF